MNSTNLAYSIAFIVAAMLLAWVLRVFLYDRPRRRQDQALANSELVRRRAIQRFIDRERNPPLPEPSNLSLERFGRAELEGLTADERVGRLSELAKILESKIPQDVDLWELFHVAAPLLVDDLRDIGHDIWHLDVGGDEQIWCADYERLDKVSKLVVKFRFPAKVRMGWGDMSF